MAFPSFLSDERLVVHIRTLRRRTRAQQLVITRLPLPFWATATSRPSCALICSMIIYVPDVTMVMRDSAFLISTSATVRLSML